MFSRERFDLEFKGDLAKTFLKTVSAFSNYNGGDIIFGIKDTGEVIGIEDVKAGCIKIENMINDSIVPMPKYNLNIKKKDEKSLIILHVNKGVETPYYYSGKTYRRSDTSTVEVDRLELNRLILEGMNINYEEKESSLKNLEFTVLEEHLKKVVGIKELDLDILRTLNLYDNRGFYNIAGVIFADKNSLGQMGIDIVRFGKDINHILDRESFLKESVLRQYDKAVEMFERYYQYEEIEGYERVTKELIPKEAFREALANAIIHRVWDVNANIRISMYEDKIEINSPGGLPTGMSRDDYLNGNVSSLRNPIIAGVFFRLKLIEKFGTGIIRINREYKDSVVKPKFDIGNNHIKVTLPIIERDLLNLSKDESMVYNFIKEEVELSRYDIDKKTGFNKAKTIRVINNLLNRNIIRKIGNGPGTTYTID
ncbi:MAG: ATP-binding protein [Anaerovoracaceae bacterium]